MSRTIVECSGCGRRLDERPDDQERQPCPYCGLTMRTIPASGGVTAGTVLGGSVRWKHIREFYERHPGWQVAVLGLTLASALVGLVIGGYLGVLIALFLGFASYVLGPRAAMRIREVEHGGTG